MEYDDTCLEKISLSPTLKVAFSQAQGIVFLDCLNTEGKWIRQNVLLIFLQMIDRNPSFLQKMCREPYRLEMKGELTRIVTAKRGCDGYEIRFEQIKDSIIDPSMTIKILFDNLLELMKFADETKRSLVHAGSSSETKNPQVLTWRAFYWIFQHEYQKIMSKECLKCLRPEMNVNHSSACVYYFEVVIDDVIAQKALLLISANRLKNTTIDVAKLFNLAEDHLMTEAFYDHVLKNVTPKHFARAVNYKFRPVFTKLNKF